MARRAVMFSVRLSESEHKRLTELAKRAGSNKGSLVRELLKREGEAGEHA